MKLRLSRTDIFTSLMCFFGMLPGIVFYKSMPDRIPIHWNINNQPDNYAAKAFVVFAIPALMFVMQLICCAFAFNRENEKVPKNAQFVCRLIIPTITIILETITVMWALEIYKNVGSVALCIVGVIMIVLGNYMPKTRRNTVFGIKLPSTLKSDEAWRKTHRLAGYLMVFAGTASVIFALLTLYIPAIILITCAVIIPVVYSLTIDQ